MREKIEAFHRECVKILELSDAEAEGISHEECDDLLEHMENSYQRLKSGMLYAGAAEKLKVTKMVVHLDRLSQIRRMTEQVIKGTQYMLTLMSMAHGVDDGTEGEQEPEEELIRD